MGALAKYGVEVYLCKITFELQKLDLALAKDAPYIRQVPSGVATVAQRSCSRRQKYSFSTCWLRL